MTTARPSRWVVGLGVLAIVLTGCTSDPEPKMPPVAEAPSTAADSVGSAAGAPGVGDPYFPTSGNGGYQVEHYDIDVTYAPRGHRLTGTTTLTARTTQALSSFDLDLVLTATEVLVDGSPVDFHQTDDHELVVDLDRELSARTEMEVSVEYSGVPEKIRVLSHIPHVPPHRPWVQTGDEGFVNGEPENAAVWFAANDHPVDKASYDITAHVPSGWQAVSNGRLVDHSSEATGGAYHWRQPAEMPSYLAFLGVGHYVIRQGTDAGLPSTYAWSTHLGKLTPGVVRAIRQTPERVRFLSRYLGEYPFDKYGAVVPEGFIATEESPGGPVYDSRLFSKRNGGGVSVMTHELAHQWFGDSVSLRRFSDLWLNEGLATWMTWLLTARTGGPSLHHQLRSMYDLHPADDPLWKPPTADPGPGNLFTFAVYLRGAMTAQALRNVIGPPTFHRLLRTWVSRRAGGHGTTAQFIALAERLSGRDLTQFAEAWLTSSGRPDDTAANGLR